MADAGATDAAAPLKPRKAGSEWFWRILAIIMVVVVSWVAWIAYQLNPPQLVTSAAFEAAAKGRAMRNAEGRIGAGADPVAATPSPEQPKPQEAREAPVNIDKLRMSETLSVAPAAPNNRAGK